MPVIYDVLKPGFMYGKQYDPNGKRRTLVADKPLKPVPSWLKKRKQETKAERKKREEQEALDAAQAEADAQTKKTEVDSANFIDGPSSTQPGGSVETL